MKARMSKTRMAIPVALGVLSIVGCADVQAQAQIDADPPSGRGVSEQQKPPLTPVQRRVVYDSVAKNKSRTAKVHFAPAVGADVPPMIELYTLPDQVLAENHTAGSYEYTLEQDKVVLVDPTKMSVVDVIGPNAFQ